MIADLGVNTFILYFQFFIFRPAGVLEVKGMQRDFCIHPLIKKSTTFQYHPFSLAASTSFWIDGMIHERSKPEAKDPAAEAHLYRYC